MWASRWIGHEYVNHGVFGMMMPPREGWLESVQGVYATLFDWVYPYVHHHVTSYLLIVAVLGWCEWVIWKRFRRLRKGLVKWGLLLVLIIIASYLWWFLMVHFRTVTQAELFFSVPTNEAVLH